LYPGAALYLKVVTLSCLSVPCAGCWETPELFIIPGILIGKLHVSPDLTVKYAIISTPNSAGRPVTRQSRAAKAEVGIRLSAAIAKNRMLISREDESIVKSSTPRRALELPRSRHNTSHLTQTGQAALIQINGVTFGARGPFL
jgi:hypothetical protein